MTLSKIKLPFGNNNLDLFISKERLRLAKSKPFPAIDCSEKEIVEKSLQNPIGGKKLSELARGCKEMVIITSDHTRALPSSITLPCLFSEARRYNQNLLIILLIATGLHRPTSKSEIKEKFGDQVLKECQVIVHDANDRNQLVTLEPLSTGTPLIVNRIAKEAQLLISEGLVEPHFFAGFSGGRKSVLPGICGPETIISNHKPQNIIHPAATSGNLIGNPIHIEAVEAAHRLNIQFTLNTIIDLEGKIRACFAGDLDRSFESTVEYLNHHIIVRIPKAPVTIVSNLGYPLDRDLYQGVKGIFTGSLVTEEGGIVILVAECLDGVGHKNFYKIFIDQKSPSELYEKILNGTVVGRDLWQVQILAKVLKSKKVGIVTGSSITDEIASNMFMVHFKSIEEALKYADSYYGESCPVNVIPEGPGIIPKSEI